MREKILFTVLPAEKKTLKSNAEKILILIWFRTEMWETEGVYNTFQYIVEQTTSLRVQRSVDMQKCKEMQFLKDCQNISATKCSPFCDKLRNKCKGQEITRKTWENNKFPFIGVNAMLEGTGGVSSHAMEIMTYYTIAFSPSHAARPCRD